MAASRALIAAGAGFGAALKGHRARLGLSQLALSTLANTSPRHLSFLENGRAQPSRLMVDCLAQALQLESEAADALRVAAGFAPRHDRAPAPAVERGTEALAAALVAASAAIGQADSPDAVTGAARSLLAALGVRYFFLGSIAAGSGRAGPLAWHRAASFPAGWLERYEEGGYHEVDPLLRTALQREDGFTWAEAMPAGAPTGRAAHIFEAAAAAGVDRGFVVPLHRPDRTVGIASMMGGTRWRDTPERRLALQVVGLTMLHRVRELGSGSGGALPPG